MLILLIFSGAELPPDLRDPLQPPPGGGVLRAVQEGVPAEEGEGPAGGGGGGLPDCPHQKLLNSWEPGARGLSDDVRV